jgi:hypothetical protein
MKIAITCHISGVLDTWTHDEVNALDLDATAAKLSGLLAERVKSDTVAGEVTVEVSFRDGRDAWAVTDNEGAAVWLPVTDFLIHDALVSFDWWDGNAWAVTR